MTKAYPKILLKPGKEHIMNSRHPWIFSMALQYYGDTENGSIVDVYDSTGKKFLARGYYNTKSQITVRILTLDPAQQINADWFVQRFAELKKERERFIDAKQTTGYRLVFGESDGVPGLIVDKYADVLVLQIHTLGMDLLKKEIVSGLKAVFNPKSIYERSDIGVRSQEGLADQPKGLLFGEPLPRELEFLENGIPMLVNIEEGQKTGMFLDQRENRKALQAYTKDKTVLNCFCYTGGFSLYAALAGAKKVTSVDSSGPALETARRNFELNGLKPEKHEFLDRDVFDLLDEYRNKRQSFDVIILDPPAFVKNQKSLKKGLQGYTFINERALQLLPTGGILVSSSCSAHVTEEMFQKMLAMAAAKARCTLKVLEIRNQPIDHPYNLFFPEGKYLKYYVLLKC
jgi:23S rRNA (cytosine1962-C5)-methyltransferase